MQVVRWSLLAVVVALSGLVFPHAGDTAGQPKPWHWTTAQAASAIRAQGEQLQPPRDLVSATCRGVTKAAPGRFVSFRCTAVLEDGKLALLAKTRRAGGLCWGVGVVPSGCLAPGKRARGSVTEASRVVYAELGPPAQTFSVFGHGSGFYSWTWVSGDVTHRGTVTFAPAPVLKVLS